MSTTTPPAPSPRSRSATWKPFMSGSWMSSRTTSGRRARTAWIAAAPSAASPTTPKPSACNTARARPRKPGWSSTISTVRMTAASSHPPGPRSSVPALRQLRWPPGWRAGAVPVRSPHHQQGSPQWVLRRKEAVMTAATDNLDARTPPTRASLSPVSAPAADLVAYVGAAAFVMAAVWYGLTARFITLAKPPAFNPNAPLDAELHRWFNWFVTTLPQERLDTGIAIIGFLCLVPLAAFARDLLGRDRVLARVGSAAMPAGALLWVAGNVLRLGGHQAAGSSPVPGVAIRCCSAWSCSPSVAPTPPTATSSTRSWSPAARCCCRCGWCGPAGCCEPPARPRPATGHERQRCRICHLPCNSRKEKERTESRNEEAGSNEACGTSSGTRSGPGCGDGLRPAERPRRGHHRDHLRHRRRHGHTPVLVHRVRLRGPHRLHLHRRRDLLSGLRGVPARSGRRHLELLGGPHLPAEPMPDEVWDRDPGRVLARRPHSAHGPGDVHIQRPRFPRRGVLWVHHLLLALGAAPR